MHLDSLGTALLEQWILSDDALSGQLWEDVCAELGYDPDVLAIAATNARKLYSRLKCGHYNIASNTYMRYGRIQCKTCAAKRSIDNVVEPKLATNIGESNWNTGADISE